MSGLGLFGKARTERKSEILAAIRNADMEPVAILRCQWVII